MEAPESSDEPYQRVASPFAHAEARIAEDNRPIAVMVPAVVANGIYFTKGQTYLAELEVKEGGLIYANSCKKN